MARCKELISSVRLAAALSAVAGCVEVVGYLDCSNVYPGIMTGNTVQVGVTLATQQWDRLALISYAVLAFFIGGLIGSVVRRISPSPSKGLALMVVILLFASIVRRDTSLRVPVELPLLAIAMALQAQAISSFGGVSIQTIVVTNSIVRFADAFTGRYVTWRLARIRKGPRPDLKDVLIPATAWIAYLLAAGTVAAISASFLFPLLIPIAIATWVAFRRPKDPTTRPVNTGV
jgi:uncharacterized membrane protein YoaK (UPF0700 family)